MMSAPPAAGHPHGAARGHRGGARTAAPPARLRVAAGRHDRRDDYAALLVRLFAFHRAVEERLAEAPPLLPCGIDIAARRRSGLLLDDLAFLGAPAAPLPAPPALPALRSVAEALGCLYVTEGATLGGRELARRLDHLLPPGSEAGRRFLLGHGARHGAMWRELCAALESCGDTPARRAEMIGAALAVFAVFGDWFAAKARKARALPWTHQGPRPLEPADFFKNGVKGPLGPLQFQGRALAFLSLIFAPMRRCPDPRVAPLTPLPKGAAPPPRRTPQ